MIPLYALVLAGLAGLRGILAGRAARTERKYAKAALAAEASAKVTVTRPGNGAGADPLTVARRQYELGRLVQTRDHYGERYVVWQGRADRVGNALYRLRRAQERRRSRTCRCGRVALSIDRPAPARAATD
ncbi:MAG: hypothetical protein U0871_11040 [Gemmataceae bacterium]